MDFPDYGLQGEARPSDFSGDYNALLFVIRQVLSKVHVAALVEVISVTGGGVNMPSSVDVQPLVNQVDGYGNAIPQGVLHGLPCYRQQGGGSAIIIDPVVGDIGIAIFADRDISSVKATSAQANPGSRRRFDVADGLYFGGTLNAAPTQYILVNASGITIQTSNPVTINCASAVIKATSIYLQNAGSALLHLVNETFLTLFNAHVHPTGSPNSGPPTVPASSTMKTSVTQAE